MGVTAFRVTAALLGLCIFLFDTLSPLEGAVAVLYGEGCSAAAADPTSL